MADYPSMFSAMMASTPTEFGSSPEQTVNDVISRNPMIGMHLRGRDLKEVLVAGPTVKDRIFLQAGPQKFQPYFPGRPYDPINPQTHTNYERPWAFSMTHVSWTEQEILMQDPSRMSRSGLFSFFKDLKAQKYQETLTDLIEGMDNAYFAVPDATTMEAAAVGENVDRQIYSLPALINDWPNGLFVGHAESAKRFSTIYGLSTTAYTDAEGAPSWQPKLNRYDYTDIDDEGVGLQSSMEQMLLDLDWRPPTGMNLPIGDAKMLGSKTDFNSYAVLTSIGGIRAYIKSLYARGESLRPQESDPAFRRNGAYVFAGFPLNWSPKLDLAAIHPGSSANTAATWSEAADVGPRFWYLSLDHLKIKFRKDKFLERRNARELDRTVEFWHMPILLHWQMFPTSLRRHGILAPGYTAPSGS